MLMFLHNNLNATALGANADLQSNSLVLGNNVNVGIGTLLPSELLNIKSTSIGQDAIARHKALRQNLELNFQNGLTNTEVVLVFILEMRI